MKLKGWQIGIVILVAWIILWLIFQALLVKAANKSRQEFYCGGIEVGMTANDVNQYLKSYDDDIQILEWGTYPNPDTLEDQTLVFAYFDSPLNRVAFGTLGLEYEDGILINFGAEKDGVWSMPNCKQVK